MTLTPANATLEVKYTLQYAASAVYSDGSTRDVTALATWSSSNTAVVTLSNAASSHGLATGAGAGVATVKAIYQGVTATTGITVKSGKLSTIAVTPNPATVSKGSKLQLTAMGTFNDGVVLNITSQCRWTSSRNAVATVSGGLVSGVSAGTATITAQKGNRSGAATVTVQ
jgi:hypothetical protein